MAFIPATASLQRQTQKALSADNTVPERYIVIDLLRQAAPMMGLTPPVLSTLDALLSCLPPRRTHHTVFASNATLTFRRNGISERTIRRHVAILQDAGLLVRHDSPNGKRFARHNTHEGKALRFGFDMSPLYDRLSDITALASDAKAEQDQIAYRRMKIRSAANELLMANPTDPTAEGALRLLRRKLTLDACEALLVDLCKDFVKAEHCDLITDDVTARDSQNVRHHQRSSKEHIDKETRPTVTEPPLSISELLTSCPEAAQYSLKEIKTISDVVSHARMLAPMIGIDSLTYQAAHDRLGQIGAATTIWAMMQFHHRLKKAGAYFRAITCGSKSRGFDPIKLVRQLGNSQAVGSL